MDISPKMMHYVEGLAPAERRFIVAILRQTSSIRSPKDRQRTAQAIADLATQYARTSHRRAQCQALDAERRTLIGARLRREAVNHYKDLARQTDRSLYRFLCDALELEAARTMAILDHAPSGTSQGSGQGTSQGSGQTDQASNKAQDIEWTPITATICSFDTRPFIR